MAKQARKALSTVGASSRNTGRKSSRVAKPPPRFRPGSSDIPEFLLSMIAEIASNAASKSPISFESGAVTALEEALEPCLEALCQAALAHAEKNGRQIFDASDLQAVSKKYMKQK